MSVTNRQREYLDAMGIQAWSLRHQEAMSVDLAAVAPAPVVATAELELQAPVVAEPAGADVWQRLAYQVSQCTACSLHQNRTQAVFGAGNQQADWMIVGEVPGLDEDRQGEPFVGPTGQLLEAMLQAVGLQRAQVFITNILKCRPLNRDPRPEELQQCQGFLRHQIALVQPRVILALGASAARALLDTPASIGQLRGQHHVYSETAIPVVVSYHPAYLLRTPAEKRQSWQDLQLAQQIVSATAV